MSHVAHKPIHTHCQNCGTELTGPYCRVCGQKDIDFHQSLGHVLHEIIETWLHLDHSFFHGIYNILFRLGKTTQEFNAGKRARHVPPFRFYLVVSLLFFFVTLPGHDQLKILEEMRGKAELLTEKAEEEARQSAEKEDNAPLPDGSGTDDKSETKLKEEFPTARLQANEGSRKMTWHPRNHPRGELDFTETIKEKLDRPVETASALLHGLPKALLACLPFFALITRVFYRKSGYVYIQHLILAFNLHSFVFLWWSATLGWSKITELIVPNAVPWVILAAVVFTFTTYYKALKDVFGRSWKATILLGTLVGTVYAIVLGIAFMVATALVVLF